jgi:mRNA interferase MazF
VVASRFDVFLVRLDPTEGREIPKTRPCLIISQDEMNHHIDTVIVAPMTTKGRPYPTHTRAGSIQGETGPGRTGSDEDRGQSSVSQTRRED